MVTIVDVNDNAPLLQPFDGAVLENTDSTLITTIQAVDKDASPQYRQVCPLTLPYCYPTLALPSHHCLQASPLQSHPLTSPLSPWY